MVSPSQQCKTKVPVVTPKVGDTICVSVPMDGETCWCTALYMGLSKRLGGKYGLLFQITLDDDGVAHLASPGAGEMHEFPSNWHYYDPA